MERVLVNKLEWLSEHTDWELQVVTTDQHRRPTFYPLPAGVGHTDLAINYSDDNGRNPLLKIMGYLLRRRRHRRRLTALLLRERPDVVVSLFPSESSFLPDIKDGSRKVLELHYCKFFRLQYGRSGLLGLIDRWRTHQDERLVGRFDRFVVLTHEDRGYWGELPNICVIPNAARLPKASLSEPRQKRVLAVGRLDYQKGFDRLLQAWALVQADGSRRDWHLDIYGQGEWLPMLREMIARLHLGDTATIHPPTHEITREYASSALLAMSSHYEGFPMVMIEAMAAGLPVVAFDFKCGPRDIIHQGEDGVIVPDGDIAALAKALTTLTDNDSLRQRMGEAARRVTHTYSEDTVMAQWLRLFNQLTQ